MTRRLFVHIGLHKTGTTYLQNLLRANRAQLRDQHVNFPGGKDHLVQTFAVWDLIGRRPRGSKDARIPGQWALLVQHVNASVEPVTLISEERLSLATAKMARRVVGSFPDAEVHVIVTARDLARVLVSAWQEELKNDTTFTWQAYAAALRDLDNRSASPARGFWMRQDLPAILETWRDVVPAERIHLVTVPPRGGDGALLTQRFCGVLGVDPARLTAKARWNNETMGVAATEVVRRLNELLDHRLNQRQYDKVVKLTLAQDLARHADAERFVLPGEELDWVTGEARRHIRAISAGGYDVVGDLEDLVPRPGPGRRPDDVGDSEVADTAMIALATLAERYATSWWNRRPDDAQVAAGPVDRLRSGVRSAVFRAQRRAVKIADANPLAGKVLASYLRRARG